MKTLFLHLDLDTFSRCSPATVTLRSKDGSPLVDGNRGYKQHYHCNTRDNVTSLKQKRQLQRRGSPQNYDNYTRQLQLKDFHSGKLEEKYGELRHLLSQEYIEKKTRPSSNPELLSYTRGNMFIYNIILVMIVPAM